MTKNIIAISLASAVLPTTAQNTNPNMGIFQFEQTANSKWSGKKNPTGQAEFIEYNGRKWKGEFERGHLNGSFSLLDKEGRLILQGTANMDTITEATQFKMVPYTIYKDGNLYSPVGKYGLVPVFSGTWKNKKWYAGRMFFDIWNDSNMEPRSMSYIDGLFNDFGYPTGEIEKYTATREAPDSFYLFYKGGYSSGIYDGFGHYFVNDGRLYKSGSSNAGYPLGTWRAYPKKGNIDMIQYLEAHGNFYTLYNDGTVITSITGWLHTQYTDGHCTKTFYDRSEKPVADFYWSFPASEKASRPDSVNFETITWKGKLFSGVVINGKPNGWGKLYNNSHTFLEGLFKEGESVGPAAELGYLKNDVPDYFAIYRDGKPVPGYIVYDLQGEEAKKAAAEKAALPKPDPVNLLTRGDVIKINGVKLTVVDNPWFEKEIIKSYRGWVTLSDGSFLNAGMPFEKLNEKNYVLYKTCPNCQGLGFTYTYTETKVLVSGATYRSYERYRGNNLFEQVTVQAQPAVYETKLISHYNNCGVCKGTLKIMEVLDK